MTEEMVRIEDGPHSNNIIANNTFLQNGSPVAVVAGGGVTYRENVWSRGCAGEPGVARPIPGARALSFRRAG